MNPESQKAQELRGRIAVARQRQKANKRAAKEAAQTVRNLVADLAVELTKPAYPEEPNWEHFSFSVMFLEGGVIYQYGALKKNSRIWLTGTSATARSFTSWESFIDWLRDKAWVSGLRRHVVSSSQTITIQ